jgi:hypothetical protein
MPGGRSERSSQNVGMPRGEMRSSAQMQSAGETFNYVASTANGTGIDDTASAEGDRI